jgi:Protein of unknown function (DUF2934)
MTTPKPAKPVAKRGRAAKRNPELPSEGEIAQRAYFIHLEDGGDDQLANWLRAERELTAA